MNSGYLDTLGTLGAQGEATILPPPRSRPPPLLGLCSAPASEATGGGGHSLCPLNTLVAPRTPPIPSQGSKCLFRASISGLSWPALSLGHWIKALMSPKGPPQSPWPPPPLHRWPLLMQGEEVSQLGNFFLLQNGKYDEAGGSGMRKGLGRIPQLTAQH